MARSTAKLALKLVVVLSLNACAHDQPAAPPVQVAASGDFYEVAPLARQGRPGDVIRSEKIVARSNAGRTVYRLLYRTRDASGHAVAATGIIVIPTAAPPAGGWPVLSWGHGTTGMAPSCAPSRLPNMPEALGFPGVIVGADYPGLGPNGQLHAYMSGLAEGRSMVDIVRAARIIGGTGVGARWIAAGASQGGHASLWAGQVARTEARDLDLLGVIAFAPSSESTTPFANDNPALGGAVTAMSLYGRATDDRRLDPAKYASPAVAKWSAILSQKCLADATAAFAALGDAARWKADPKTTEPARSIWLANDPGRAKTG